MNCLPGERDSAQQLFGNWAKSLAGRGQRHVGVHAGEEFYAQRFFQGADARADGGLADAQRSGGAMKSAIGGHR